MTGGRRPPGGRLGGDPLTAMGTHPTVGCSTWNSRRLPRGSRGHVRDLTLADHGAGPPAATGSRTGTTQAVGPVSDISLTPRTRARWPPPRPLGPATTTAGPRAGRWAWHLHTGTSLSERSPAASAAQRESALPTWPSAATAGSGVFHVEHRRSGVIHDQGTGGRLSLVSPGARPPPPVCCDQRTDGRSPHLPVPDRHPPDPGPDRPGLLATSPKRSTGPGAAPAGSIGPATCRLSPGHPAPAGEGG